MRGTRPESEGGGTSGNGQTLDEHDWEGAQEMERRRTACS
jgi:hypothetical protein